MYLQVPALSSASVWGRCRVQGCSGQFGDTDGVKGCSDWFGDIDKVKGCTDRFGDIAKWKDAQTSLGTLLRWRDAQTSLRTLPVWNGGCGRFGDTAGVEGHPCIRQHWGLLRCAGSVPFSVPIFPSIFPWEGKKCLAFFGGEPRGRCCLARGD